MNSLSEAIFDKNSCLWMIRDIRGGDSDASYKLGIQLVG